jgi:hypothetical protein
MLTGKAVTVSQAQSIGRPVSAGLLFKTASQPFRLADREAQSS